MVVAKTLRGADGPRAPAAGAHGDAHYLALARGDLARSVIVDAPIGRHPVAAHDDGGRRERQARAHARRRARASSARRRWCAAVSRPAARTRSACISPSLGHPLVGDPVYGGRAASVPEALRAFRAPGAARANGWRSCIRSRGASARGRRRCRRTSPTCSRRSTPIRRRRRARDEPRATLRGGGSRLDRARRGTRPPHVHGFVDDAQRRRERGRCRRRWTSVRRICARSTMPAATRSSPIARASARSCRRHPCGSSRFMAPRSSRSMRAMSKRRARVRRSPMRPSRACPTCRSAVRTADCLPVLLADDAGTRRRRRARGMARACRRRARSDGRTRCTSTRASLVAWLGPAIGPRAFEVGDDVRDAFGGQRRRRARALRSRVREGKWLADLPALARRRLAAAA